MSTYGTALVFDVAPEGSVGAVMALLGARDPHATTLETGSGWTRVTAFLADVGQLALVEHAATSAGRCRVAVAEDNDEYGALWVVLSASEGRVTTVHRRYVLNADPHDPSDVATALRDLDWIDPREVDVAGADAAAAAAELFEVDPDVMVAAERDSDSAFKEIGVVGGPFPWWDALGLPWPGS
ncbi:MAG TPA: hypothetical protein VLB29_03550 [Nocardioidaceae bacterium]|nr:hypothetical protein [Nocardioidaceae bacterium]